MLTRTEQPGLVMSVDAEPIPGYRLISPLGKGGFGEVWKCEAPGGLYKAIKVVSSATEDSVLPPEQCGAEQEMRALQHIKTIRHPFLLSNERVERVGRDLVIVMELADCSLHDLLDQYKTQGHKGIPREELLGYMLETAEVLDLMNQEHGLQHLDVKPRNIFLVGRHVKVADFGLVASLAEMNGQKSANFQLAAITPIYASPESFTGKITLFSDQYSLAIVYYELLTGTLPFNGKNFRALAMQHMAEPPNLSLLSEGERAAVDRAMSKEPRKRFPNCLEFVKALLDEAHSSAARHDTSSMYAGPKNSTLLEINLNKKSPTASVRPPTKLLRTVRPQENVPVTCTVRTPVEDTEISLDDHQFIDCLGTSPLGEMWRTEAPNGIPCLVKLVNTFAQNGLFGDDNPLIRLQGLQHRGLLPTTYVPREPNRIALISELTQDTVGGRFQQARADRQPGIQRDLVLEWLGQLAQTLDELFIQHRLQHLGLNPRNLILHDDQLLLADFGLVQLIWLPAGQQVAQMNARYSPPELFNMQVTRHSDQYSLALLYYELVTGVHPFANQSQRQLMQMRSTGNIDLDLLATTEQRILLKALHPEANRRFNGCGEFIDALLNQGMRPLPGTPGSGMHRTVRPSGMVHALPPRLSGVSPAVTARSSGMRPAVRVEESTPPPVDVPTANDSRTREALAQIVQAAAGTLEVREYRGVRYSIRAGVSAEHVSYARLVPGTVELKLASFCEQWNAQLVTHENDLFVFRINLQSSFLMRCLGKQPALEITVQVVTPQLHHATMADVLMRIAPVACNKEQAIQALDHQAPRLIESLRNCLQAGPERRRQIRLPYQVPVQVMTLDDLARGSEPLMAQGKDITLDGMGLYMRSAPTTDTMVVKMQRSAVDPIVNVMTKVVRINTCGDGRYEVGLRFQTN